MQKLTPYTCTSSSYATNPNNILLLLQAPVRNCREAAVPEKETKILKERARGEKGSPDQNESPIPDLSNAL